MTDSIISAEFRAYSDSILEDVGHCKVPNTEKAIRAALASKEQEVERLREALKFYADLPDKDTAYEEWYDDEGKIAKQALEEKQ